MNMTYKMTSAFATIALVAMTMAPTASASAADSEVVDLTGLNLSQYAMADVDKFEVGGVDLLLDCPHKDLVSCIVWAVNDYCDNSTACQLALSLVGTVIDLVFYAVDVAFALAYYARDLALSEVANAIVLVNNLIDIAYDYAKDVCDRTTQLCPLIAQITTPIGAETN